MRDQNVLLGFFMVHVSPRARAYSMCETETNQSQHDPAISRRISNAADFETYGHLATPRSTARTVAKTVVVQIMSRRVEVTTGKNPDRSGAFNGLACAALRGCRVTGFLCVMFSL